MNKELNAKQILYKLGQTNMSSVINSLGKKIFLLTSFVIVASCTEFMEKHDLPKDPIDRVADLKREDYLKELSPKPVGDPVSEVKVEAKTPTIPKASDLILTPQRPRLGINKTVSLSVTDDVPLKDVFIELARLADVDIEVDSAITGGIIFKAKNKPFDEVIERICNMAGLRYSVKDGVIRVETDKVYVENYQVGFLNVTRTVNGQVTSNTTLGGTGGGGSSGGSSGGSGGSSGGSGGGGGSSGASISNGSSNNISYKSSGDGDVWKSVVEGIGTIINDPSAAAAAAGSKTAGAASSGSGSVTINREAGVVSVKATAKNHAMIKEYIEKIKDFYSAQVLIEAKVVEVSLDDEFRSGIDWNLASQKILGANVSAILPTGGFRSLATPNLTDSMFSSVTLNAGDLNAVVKLAEVFGTTRTLSSPRILVMNNQQAALSFAKNENYYSLTCETTDPVQPTTVNGVGTPGKLKVTSTLNSIPIGVILNLQPSIDTKNSQISMDIRPTLTRLTGKTYTDPGIILCSANAVSILNFDPDQAQALIDSAKVPQVDVREMDSVLRLKSGEIMAIGGMIDQKVNNTDSGIPYLSSVPILGNAFKAVDKTNQTVQTVIFLKATIVPGYGVDKPDQHLYNNFTNDPRPTTF